MNLNPQGHRSISLHRRAAIGVASLAIVGFGLGVVGAGTAFAQTRHQQARTASVAKPRVVGHERRESPRIRASETSSNDPASTDWNESTGSSSPDPSANDKRGADKSARDTSQSNDTPSPDSVSGQLS